jgi:4-hydroxy-3-methylbut-2-enyl diphosphate reductase IspH
MMKIILANPRGFCAGVNMAIDVVDQVLAHRGAPVYVYHEIVHNRHVVEDFQHRGVVFVNDVSEVPEARWSCTAPMASRRRSGEPHASAASSRWMQRVLW